MEKIMRWDRDARSVGSSPTPISRFLVFMVYPGNDDEKALARAELVRLMQDEPTRYRALYHRYGPRQDGWGHTIASTAGSAS
jgi:hypothetical protein